jgi:uncharacterized protein (DUF302 family)
VASGTHEGIINKPSNHSVDQTVEKLKAMLQSKGVTLFVIVDQVKRRTRLG